MKTRLLNIAMACGVSLLAAAGFSQDIVNMSNGSTFSCSGEFYDSGGPAGQFGTNESFVHTFTGAGQMQFNFTAFQSDFLNWGTLVVHDGPDVSAPVIATFNSDVLIVPGLVTGSGPSLTFAWSSVFGQGPGFAATFECINAPLTGVLADTIILSCFGDILDSIAPSAVFGENPPFTYEWSTGGTDSVEYNVGPGAQALTITDNVGDKDTVEFFVYEPEELLVDAQVDVQYVCDYDITSASASGSGGTTGPSYITDTSIANFAWDTSEVGTSVGFIYNGEVSEVLDIGFDFVFFGDTFNQFVMASSGFISFDISTAGGFGGANGTGENTRTPIPFYDAGDNRDPNNAIYAFWYSLEPEAGRRSYYTTGSAPNRRLVVTMDDVADCCSPFNPAIGSGQIILHESSGCIEIMSDGFAPGTGFGDQSIQGIENAAGTEGYAYPGWNGDLYSDTSQTYISFCPVDENGLVYRWSNGGTGSTLFIPEPGTHSVRAQDANGCLSSEASVTFDEPESAFTSALSYINVSCFGYNDGSINPGITGGAADVVFEWSSGETTDSVSNLRPGYYSVSAEDVLGCTIEVNDVLITEPGIFQAFVNSVTAVSCPGDSTGQAVGIAVGGIPPHTYAWTSSDEVGQIVSGLTDGAYHFVATDSIGCESVAGFTIIAENSLPMVDLGPDLFSSEDASFTLDAGNAGSTFAWSDASTEQTITVTESGTYSVTVTNAAGCTYADEVEVEIWPTGISSLSNAGIKVYPNPAALSFNIQIDDASNASVEITDVKGSVVKSVNTLSTGVNAIDISTLSSGVYILSISNNNQVVRQQLNVTK